jgi:hypothetical protein
MPPLRRTLQPLSDSSDYLDFPTSSGDGFDSLAARLETLSDTLREEREDLNRIRELSAAGRMTFNAVLNHPALNMLPGARRRPSSSPDPPQEALTVESIRAALQDNRIIRLRSNLHSRSPPSYDTSSNEPRSLRRPRERPLLTRLVDEDVAFVRYTEETLSQTASELPTVSAQLRILRAQLRDESDVALVGETEERVLEMAAYLTGWTSRLRTLHTQMMSDLDNAAEQAERVDQRRQSKRRKLAHDGDLPNNAPIKYGWNGQVEPGDLKLEIVSCDGGDYGPPEHTGFRAENVLRNDYSVYCSRSAMCNILFRHQGETIFHLDTFVVKAPECGFSAPIQQGLIFVGMNKEELVSGSAAYHMRYDRSATYPPSSGILSEFDEGPIGHERLTFLESLNDHHTWLAVQTQRMHYNHAYRDRQRRNGYVAPYAEETIHVGPRDDADAAYGQDCDLPIPNDQATSQSGLTTAPTPPPFGFTITAEDSEDVPDEDESIVERLRQVQQRRRRGGQPRGEDAAARGLWNRRAEIRPERRSSPSRIVESQPNDRVVALRPIASFFISRTKSKITLKFEPSV